MYVYIFYKYNIFILSFSYNDVQNEYSLIRIFGWIEFFFNFVTHYYTGEIVGAESAFVYRNGTNHSDYHNASYVPYFLDEINNQTLLDEAVLVCGDASRVQCIFDYIFMDRRTAEQTLKLDKEQQVTSGELGM